MGRGSSPRWRGGQSRRTRVQPRPGVIPALAGRTGRVPNTRAGARVIPALAGRTRLARWPCPTAPGHPRAGGADCCERFARAARTGSSPRWRGGRSFQVTLLSANGVIPALAGRTSRLLLLELLPRGHPRAGGADARQWLENERRMGSSPRWWGGHAPGFSPLCRRRVIPALAGRTRERHALGKLFRGHPRAGGADPDSLRRAESKVGSSPRWRGGRHSVSRWARVRRGHPRAGGADLRRFGRKRLILGSSPRWRGGRGVGHVRHGLGGVIPALAGRTTSSTRGA